MALGLERQDFGLGQRRYTQLMNTWFADRYCNLLCVCFKEWYGLEFLRLVSLCRDQAILHYSLLTPSRPFILAAPYFDASSVYFTGIFDGRRVLLLLSIVLNLYQGLLSSFGSSIPWFWYYLFSHLSEENVTSTVDLAPKILDFWSLFSSYYFGIRK